MAGRTRHLKEKGGRFYARLAVPKALQPHTGKMELLMALGGDRREALRQLPQAVANLQAQLETVPAGDGRGEAKRSPLLEGDPVSKERLAVGVYNELVRQDEHARNNHGFWAKIGVNTDVANRLRDGYAGRANNAELYELVGYLMENIRRQGLAVPEYGMPKWRDFAMALCAAHYEAMSRMAERDDGDFTGRPSHPVLNSLDDPELQPPAPVDLLLLWKDYVASRQRVGSMRDGGRRQVLAVESLVKHTKGLDANQITKKDILGWRDELLETLAPQTLAKIYLPTVRSLFKWAVENDRMTSNPAEGIRQSAPKAMKSREKGYTDAEALHQITGSVNYQPKLSPAGKPLEDPKVTLAKRWIPLLCAFSGARITELAQLRREDFREETGHWIMRISPDAGSVKTNQFRDVPLHPQLVELGFIREIGCLPLGPLFHMAPTADLNHVRARKMTDRLRDWVHDEHLVPDGLQPWHGWRHRFKTVGVELGIDGRVLDCIQGHASRTAGEMYGDVTMKAKIDAISRFPSFKLE